VRFQWALARRAPRWRSAPLLATATHRAGATAQGHARRGQAPRLRGVLGAGRKRPPPPSRRHRSEVVLARTLAATAHRADATAPRGARRGRWQPPRTGKAPRLQGGARHAPGRTAPGQARRPRGGVLGTAWPPPCTGHTPRPRRHGPRWCSTQALATLGTAGSTAPTCAARASSTATERVLGTALAASTHQASCTAPRWCSTRTPCPTRMGARPEVVRSAGETAGRADVRCLLRFRKWCSARALATTVHRAGATARGGAQHSVGRHTHRPCARLRRVRSAASATAPRGSRRGCWRPPRTGQAPWPRVVRSAIPVSTCPPWTAHGPDGSAARAKTLGRAEVRCAGGCRRSEGVLGTGAAAPRTGRHQGSRVALGAGRRHGTEMRCGAKLWAERKRGGWLPRLRVRVLGARWRPRTGQVPRL
jgi:hypothetical protein